MQWLGWSGRVADAISHSRRFPHRLHSSLSTPSYTPPPVFVKFSYVYNSSQPCNWNVPFPVIALLHIHSYVLWCCLYVLHTVLAPRPDFSCNLISQPRLHPCPRRIWQLSTMNRHTHEQFIGANQIQISLPGRRWEILSLCGAKRRRVQSSRS